MSKNEIKRFIMYYERITKQMLQNLNNKANFTIEIDGKHKLKTIKFN